MPMPSSRTKVRGLSVASEEARQLAITASCLSTATSWDLGGILSQLVCVQLDAINAVARAHELTIATRLDGRTTHEISQMLWADASAPVAFEYCGHAASLQPITDWPLWEFRRNGTRRANLDWRPETNFQQTILDRLRIDGPQTMKQLRGDAAASDGWSWSPTKTAIEYLVWTGEVVCVRREGWNRVFDLPERQIPTSLLNHESREKDGLRRLVERAAQALGVATAGDIADYLRISEIRLLDLESTTSLIPVHVDGWTEQAWAHSASLEQSVNFQSRQVFVGPFDNLVWHRKRLQRLFRVDHRLEAYVTPLMRVYGYFVMLLLDGVDIVGRADIKLERGSMRTFRYFPEVNRTDLPDDYADALAHLTRLTGSS